MGECDKISVGQAIGNHIHKNGKQIVKRNNNMNNTCSSGNEFDDLVLDDMDLIDFVNDRQQSQAVFNHCTLSTLFFIRNLVRRVEG